MACAMAIPPTARSNVGTCNADEKKFPHFHLEDNVTFQPRGIVRPPLLKKYYRRGAMGNKIIDQETVI